MDRDSSNNYLILGLVMVNLLFLSACGDGVKSWRLPEGSLERKQAFLRAAMAESFDERQVPGGNPDQGWQALQAYGCPSCHVIPGVPGADSLVGPPLTDWAGRGFIAGNLPNTPDNLIEWIRYPQSIEPGTAMPDLGVSEQDARDIAAWLYTLEP